MIFFINKLFVQVYLVNLAFIMIDFTIIRNNYHRTIVFYTCRSTNGF